MIWVNARSAGDIMTQGPRDAVHRAGTACDRLSAMSTPGEGNHWNGIIAGGNLALSACIDFEGRANVAGEAKDPLNNMPAAILVARVISTLLCPALAVIAIAAGPISERGAPEALLAGLSRSPGYPGDPLFAGVPA